MLTVLHKYRLVLIIISLAIATAIIWTVLFRQNSKKIPMRGVFVMGSILQKYDNENKTVFYVQNI